MKQLIYGLPSAVGASSHLSFPGMQRFANFFALHGKWAFLVDRTGTFTTPVRSISLFPIPAFRPMPKSFEAICNERALEILAKSDKKDSRIHVMYSGGIDSTCLLVSLLKHADTAQKKRITVLLSHESIAENPRFYDEHIKGKFALGPSISFPTLIGENTHLVSGEHSDLILGWDRIGKFLLLYGPAAVHGPYQPDRVLEFLTESVFQGDRAMGAFCLNLFERLRNVAPIPLTTNFAFLWWANYAIKWQACYSYMLLFTLQHLAERVTPEYLEEYFISFYNTDDFQLWAMHNLDKRIKDTWQSYKWVLKDIIYDYTKDAEYRAHKTKRGSLLPLTGYNPPYRFIAENMRFTNEFAPEDYFLPENDFV